MCRYASNQSALTWGALRRLALRNLSSTPAPTGCAARLSGCPLQHGRRGTTKCCDECCGNARMTNGPEKKEYIVQSDLFPILVRIRVLHWRGDIVRHLPHRVFCDQVGNSRGYWRLARLVVFAYPGVGRRAGLAHRYVDGATASAGSTAGVAPKPAADQARPTPGQLNKRFASWVEYSSESAHAVLFSSPGMWLSPHFPTSPPPFLSLFIMVGAIFSLLFYSPVYCAVQLILAFAVLGRGLLLFAGRRFAAWVLLFVACAASSAAAPEKLSSCWYAGGRGTMSRI